jgi:hypothetical protein
MHGADVRADFVDAMRPRAWLRLRRVGASRSRVVSEVSVGGYPRERSSWDDRRRSPKEKEASRVRAPVRVIIPAAACVRVSARSANGSGDAGSGASDFPHEFARGAA